MIEVHCLPKDLPATLQFDVTNLDIGNSLSIASAEFPEGVSASLDGDVLIAIVNETRASVSEGGDDESAEGSEEEGGEEKSSESSES
jgi:large subunit ribosomal protein L25